MYAHALPCCSIGAGAGARKCWCTQVLGALSVCNGPRLMGPGLPRPDFGPPSRSHPKTISATHPKRTYLSQTFIALLSFATAIHDRYSQTIFFFPFLKAYPLTTLVFFWNGDECFITYHSIHRRITFRVIVTGRYFHL